MSPLLSIKYPEQWYRTDKSQLNFQLHLRALKIKNDPSSSKIFKNLQMHVAKGAASAKMAVGGFDKAVRDTGSDPPAPSQDDESKIAMKDDSRFSRFIKIPQTHMQKVAVEAKIAA
jgi:hypothetical protein